MLVLTRRPDTRLRIRTKSGETAWIEIVEVYRDRVRIGITADRSIEIMREEILPADEWLGATAERSER
jgi:carbon storage regulator CsrA